MRLSEFVDSKRSIIDLLPDEVVEELVAARRANTHGPSAMVRWLHNNPEFGDDYKHVTVQQLEKWFARRGIRAGSE